MTAGRKNTDTLSKHWNTPIKYITTVKAAFNGTIELDPCSNNSSIVDAKISWSLPSNDGLKEIWNFKTIYVNPPYGSDAERGTRISDWLKKCANSYKVFDSEVIALIPVATNTLHWKQSIFGCATGICFLYDTRLRFLEDGKDVGKGAPMACAAIYWGQKYEKFAKAFAEHGAVISLLDIRLPKMWESITPKQQ